ncbi:MAG: hypothetical protein PF487_11740 [Bacteroidales bacterium]|jgi:hypothetical protein|nr:hypothetical protein [Bacteroidales bacterium]
MENILTISEVREALYLDYDYNVVELERLSKATSSFLLRKTGYDFGKDDDIEPLAKQAAILYVRSQFFNGANYRKEYDFTLGINSLLVDLQLIADEKIALEALAV